MKFPILSFICFSAALMLVAPGCGRKDRGASSTQLEQSFQDARPEVKQALSGVNAHLQARDYGSAAKTLAPIVLQQNLTEAQKEAVGGVLQQINQAVAADRSLNTKEMYELRATMFQALHSTGKRF